MSKVCSKCKIEKDESEFYVNNKAVDGLDHYCKDCRKAYSHDNRKNHYEYIKQYQEENRAFVESLKTRCVKCDEDRPWVIQFHHIDHKTKEFDVTQCGSHSRSAIWKEAGKCVCLCSNCHDEFHHFFGRCPDDPVEALEKYLNEDF